MSDALPWMFTVIVSIPLVVFAVFDLQVARELHVFDREKPVIPFLGLVKGIVYGISAAAVIFAVLGIQSAVFLMTGIRLLPQPIPFLAIYFGCIIASLMVYRLRRWIRAR